RDAIPGGASRGGPRHRTPPGHPADRTRRPVHGRGGAARVLRARQGVLGGAVRGRARGGSRRELLLHGLDHGPAAARSRGAPACGTPRPTAATTRPAPRLAGAATTAG